MCGIFCSSSKEMLVKLASLNQYRGSHSYSVYNAKSQKLVKEFGEFNPEALGDDGEYHICHVQAPTTAARGLDSVHPAMNSNGGAMLWHNGIVKDHDIKRLQRELNMPDCEWDTQLLLKGLTSPDWSKFLSTVNGSFACILVEGNQIYAFRNKISPLYIDENFNISSVMFEGADPLPPETMWSIKLDTKELKPVVTFQTYEQPFFFFDE